MQQQQHQHPTGRSSNQGFCLQESHELLQRQFEELSKGLQDEAPAVRMTAASGICSLLNMYWELVPAGTTAAYLKRLTGSNFTSRYLSALTSPQTPHRSIMHIAPLKSGCAAVPCWLMFCTTHVGHAYNLLVIVLLLSASIFVFNDAQRLAQLGSQVLRDKLSQTGKAL